MTRMHILSIGTELAIGQTVDTNAAWLAQQCAALGLAASRHVTIPDDRAAIRDAIAASAREAHLVLISGGLGPTPDDLSRDALADALGVELRLHEPSLGQIEAYFQQRCRTMHEANRVQAMIPVGSKAIPNAWGTAPGIHAKLGACDIFVMPGVPAEMKAMFNADVLPRLSTRVGPGTSVIRQYTLRSFGMSESEIGARLANLMARGRNPEVGTSADELVISIRVNAGGSSVAAAEQLATADLAVIRERLGIAVYGEDDETLADAVAKLLTKRCATIATAESCTGGLLAKWLTDVAGSSAYFVQGFVTYSNEAKWRMLGVPKERLDSVGAVSEEVARAMAEGCRQAAGVDYALSTTGIAGPTGGTAAKPVGLVFVALADSEKTDIRALHLGETLSRSQIRDRSVKAALNLLRLRLA